MSTPRRLLKVSLVALGALGLWYGLAKHSAPSATVATNAKEASTTLTGTSSRVAVAERNAATPAGPAAPAAPSPVDYAKAFRAATNYESFILDALPAAQNGNRDAQYYLYAAISYCDETNRFFFKKRGKTLTVDEAIAERSATGDYSLIEGIRRAAGRCHEVNAAHGPAWGDANQWLAMATEAGQPIAQAITAEKIAFQSVSSGYPEVKPFGSLGKTYTLSDARALIRAAVETKDPDVLFRMGDLLRQMKPEQSTEDAAREAVTWRYVACLRGLDCSPGAEWHLQICLHDPNCLPYESGVDYWRKTALQMHITDLDDRAAALNAKIDADAWEALGLGE